MHCCHISYVISNNNNNNTRITFLKHFFKIQNLFFGLERKTKNWRSVVLCLCLCFVNLPATFLFFCFAFFFHCTQVVFATTATNQHNVIRRAIAACCVWHKECLPSAFSLVFHSVITSPFSQGWTLKNNTPPSPPSIFCLWPRPSFGFRCAGPMQLPHLVCHLHNWYSLWLVRVFSNLLGGGLRWAFTRCQLLLQWLEMGQLVLWQWGFQKGTYYRRHCSSIRQCLFFIIPSLPFDWRVLVFFLWTQQFPYV